MRKYIAFTLIALFIVLTLFGCSKKANTNQTPDPSYAPNTPKINNEDAITRTPNSIGIFPPVEKEEIKIGVIYNSDPEAVASDSYAHDQGIEEAREVFELKSSQIIKKN
jgi:basic membrane protein A